METAATPAVLLLDLPKSALLGIDLLAFTTTPRFQGIRNVPLGLHFVFTGTSTAFSVRHGRWFNIESAKGTPSGAPLIIAKWDITSEALVSVSNEAEELRWRANLGKIWRESLTPYRQSVTDANTDTDELRDDWPQLTAHISHVLLSRITSSGDPSRWTLNSASSAKRDLDHIPGLSAEESNLHQEKDLNFLHVDLKQTWREGATGRERTDAAQDRSWALNELIEKHCAGGNVMEIVGELQFCFLMVLTLNNWSCFEQWKRLLTLLFTCRATVTLRADLFIRAIATLRLQLQHCKDAEGGLIDLADEGGSLLKKLLVRFRKGLEWFSSIDTQDVIDELDDLEAYLRDEHGWELGGSFARTGMLELEDGEQVRVETAAYDEEYEDGEYAPQIVDLTPEQARMLKITDAGDLRVSLSKTSLHEVVARDADRDTSSGADEGDDARSQDEESEEADDIDDMDARY